jgi:hypothetical protein
MLKECSQVFLGKAEGIELLVGMQDWVVGFLRTKSAGLNEGTGVGIRRRVLSRPFIKKIKPPALPRGIHRSGHA